MKAKRLFSLGLLGLVTLLILSACAPTATEPSNVPVTGPEGEPVFEADFIRMMVPHHEGAVEMAKIAQERAEHPEIKQMAEDILTTQSSEIEQMRGWLKEWYGSEEIPSMSEMPMLEGMPDMGHGHGMDAMDMQAEVEKLRNAAEPFDLAFLTAMIDHHQSAIDAARVAQEKAQRLEVKEMAEAILKTQQAEIDQMTEWRKTWYNQ